MMYVNKVLHFYQKLWGIIMLLLQAFKKALASVLILVSRDFYEVQF